MFSSDLFVYILPNGMGKSRVDIFKNALLKNNAQVVDEIKGKIEFNGSALIVLVDETIIFNWETFEKAMAKKKINSNVSLDVVKSKWLSECLKLKRKIDLAEYVITKPIVEDSKIIPKRTLSDKGIKANEPKRSKISIESSSDSLDSVTDDNGDDVLEDKSKNLLNSRAWICAHSSKELKTNLNKDITDKLEELLQIYENTNDKYRALGYQKAIAALKRYPKRITTWNEAKSLNGVGKRLADKIWEIVQHGQLEKLDFLNNCKDLTSINQFTKIHGVGPSTAQNFISQGFRTLDDLRTRACLNRQQLIGLKYIDEFQIRIPRDEVVIIERIVREAALGLNPGLILQVCGSYRRGKATCGDVDILITHPDGISHEDIFAKLIELLHEKKFLTDDLVRNEENGNQKKYLGVCLVPGENSIHRRLDIIVVPYDEYACALLYFTGSAHFNRSMRLLARKMGMSLSEHSLNKNVHRHGTEKVTSGERILALNEESVFKVLGISYRTPEERDF